MPIQNWGFPGGDSFAGNVEGGANDTLTVHGATRINNILRVVSGGGVGSVAVGDDEGGVGQASLNLVGEANGGKIEAGFRFQQFPNSIVLRINTNPNNGDVIISHPDGNPPLPSASVEIRSPRLRIGPGNQAGNIDANGLAVIGQPLNIGTRDTTSRVEIGNTLVPGFLTQFVTQTQFIGQIQVGAAANTAGRIDAQLDGAASRKLEIGTQDTTADVRLGRAGQTVQVSAPLNVNGNAFALNALGTLKIVANAAGHGAGPAGDFMVGNAVVGWWDLQGVHVLPPP